eukprot:sb/3476470/
MLDYKLVIEAGNQGYASPEPGLVPIRVRNVLTFQAPACNHLRIALLQKEHGNRERENKHTVGGPPLDGIGENALTLMSSLLPHDGCLTSNDNLATLMTLSLNIQPRSRYSGLGHCRL